MLANGTVGVFFKVGIVRLMELFFAKKVQLFVLCWRDDMFHQSMSELQRVAFVFCCISLQYPLIKKKMVFNKLLNVTCLEEVSV